MHSDGVRSPFGLNQSSGVSWLTDGVPSSIPRAIIEVKLLTDQRSLEEPAWLLVLAIP